MPGSSAALAATNRAGDIVSAHIHPVEQGNFLRDFIDHWDAVAVWVARRDGSGMVRAEMRCA